MKTYMFPGQGSQSKGMGEALFDAFPELTAKADHILGYSIKELCVQDPRRELNKTQFTQPALYVVNALSYYKKVADSGTKPDYLAGHSLGEFNALLAAECFDFESGLRMVQKRGELMGQISGGAMAAIMNASKDEIVATLNKHGLTNIDLANYNTPAQIVISGLADEITRAATFFQEGRVLFYPLNTSGAFHSRYMQSVKEEFTAFLQNFAFAEPKTPVIANVTARPYQHGQVLDNLAQQIASTVRWSESIQYLLELEPAMELIELGHGDVLTKLAHYIRQQTPSLQRAPAPQPAPKAEEAPQPADVAEKVRFWNRRYPIGTRVKSLVMDYGGLETRTEAMVLFGHRAAVYMKGYNGYFDLDEIAPA
jgi:malonyl CoA-acyl carrier protein transacylase